MNAGLDVDLKPVHFEKICNMLYEACGIHLQAGKEGLVMARLAKRLNALKLVSFEAYLAHIHHDKTGHELSRMVDVLTTNKTNFFREQSHFDFLRHRILPDLKHQSQGMRIWSAACSSGEEPVSIAILLREELPNIDRRDIKILATDISSEILGKARKATYRQDMLQDVPEVLLRKYFTRVGTADAPLYQVCEPLRRMVRFARLNLIDTWPMKGRFQAILCRNVMIYFDAPTRQRLVHRFYDYLEPGGFLFIGHSESLTGFSHPFHYVQPAVYVK